MRLSLLSASIIAAVLGHACTFCSHAEAQSTLEKMETVFAAGKNKWTANVKHKSEFLKLLSSYEDNLYKAARGSNFDASIESTDWVNAVLSSKKVREDLKARLNLQRLQLTEFSGERALSTYEKQLSLPKSEIGSTSSAELIEIAKKNRPSIWTDRIKSANQLHQLVEYYACLRDPKRSSNEYEGVRNSLKAFAGNESAFDRWESEFLKGSTK